MSFVLLDDEPQAAVKPAKGKFLLLDDAADPTRTFGENVAAGAGKAIYDLARGGGQILRSGIEAVTPRKTSELVTGKRDTLADKLGLPTEADVAEARELDKPLMETAGGLVGNVAGHVGVSLLVPGVGTYKGAVAAGGALGALQPTVDGESRIQNAAIGAGAGVAGKAVGDKVAGAVANRLTARDAALTAEASRNAPRDAALEAGRKAGYVVPPRMVEKQGVLGSVVEAVGGRTKTEQLASNRNQAVTNELARTALGVADDTPITPELLKGIRAKAGEAYETLRGVGTITADKQFVGDLGKITQKYQGASKDFPELARNEIAEVVASVNKPSFTTDAAVDAMSILRERAASAFGKGDKSLGTAYRQTSQALEDAIERRLIEGGSREALSAFQAARRTIAKTYTVEKALDAGGNVSASRIAADLKKGKPITEELRTIGEFAGNFQKAAQSTAKVEPYSVTDAFAAGMLGTAGGLPAAALPLVRPAARSLVLSPTYQRLMANPEYGTSLMLRGSAEGSKVLPRLLPGAAAGYAGEQ